MNWALPICHVQPRLMQTFSKKKNRHFLLVICSQPSTSVTQRNTIRVIHPLLIVCYLLPPLRRTIAMGFNQKKPPDRTVCVAVDLSAAFDTVSITNCSHSSTDHSSLRPRRDDSPVFWEVDKPRLVQMCKSTSGKVNTGVTQFSQQSPSYSALTLLTCSD